MFMRNKIILLSAMTAIVFSLVSCGGKNQDEIIDFYCMNDFHGHIVEKKSSSSRYYEPGISKTSGYLKQRHEENPNNFVLLNAGDMFQETYDSGYNKGEILAKIMPIMETEAMAIGNHEFDWGIDILKRNKQLSDTTAYLGANIYHYDEMRKQATDFASDLCDPYKIIERSGIKIGLIGIIGMEQITSITSTNTFGYTFLQPAEIVMNLSDKLRKDDGCDIVIVISHADRDGLDEVDNFSRKVTGISPLTNKRYVDGVFTAHSHKKQLEQINDVVFVQSGAHGQAISHIALHIKNGTISTEGAANITIPRSSPEDPEINSLLSQYLNDDYYADKNKTLGNIHHDTYDNVKINRSLAGNMFAWMSYETLIKDETCPNVDIVINNGGRNDIMLPNGNVSKGLLFDCMPFTNKTLVADIKGKDIRNELFNYNNYYYAPKPLHIYNDELYKVAVIDYLLIHKNANKNFDYFPSLANSEIEYKLDKEPYEIMSDFFIEHPNLNYSEIANKAEYSYLS